MKQNQRNVQNLTNTLSKPRTDFGRVSRDLYGSVVYLRTTKYQNANTQSWLTILQLQTHFQVFMKLELSTANVYIGFQDIHCLQLMCPCIFRALKCWSQGLFFLFFFFINSPQAGRWCHRDARGLLEVKEKEP